MSGKMGEEFVRVNWAKNTARLQAASYGPGVEVVVQLRGTRGTFVSVGDEVEEIKTIGWEDRSFTPYRIPEELAVPA